MQTVPYELTLNAQMGGVVRAAWHSSTASPTVFRMACGFRLQVRGSITFTAADGRFLWFTVEVRIP